MKLLRMFSIGADSILSKGHSVQTTVSNVYRCWWLRINTKPVRRFSGDGAIYPHIISFTYEVDGTTYEGKLWIPVRYRVPAKGETIAVYYDPEKPGNYACYAFGLNTTR